MWELSTSHITPVSDYGATSAAGCERDFSLGHPPRTAENGFNQASVKKGHKYSKAISGNIGITLQIINKVQLILIVPVIGSVSTQYFYPEHLNQCVFNQSLG